MVEDQGGGRRLYKARGADGEVAWVDHQELWRLQQSQAEEARRQQARRRRLLLFALIGLLAVALVLVVLWLRPAGLERPDSSVARVPADDGPAMEPRVDPAASPAEAARSEGMASDPGAAVAAAEGAAEPAATAGLEEESATSTAVNELEAAAAIPPGQRVAETVRAWAAAWAGQDVAAYLAAYSTAFTPADGLSRSSWQELRRRRLLAPASIAVEIEELQVTVRQPGRAEARFLQRYRSPIYADVVRKTLDLVEERGAWRILAERVEPR